VSHVRLTRAVEFSTSLRYWNPDLSEAENRARFGRKASRHGHNYRLEVMLIGEPDPVTGMVIDLKDLQDVIDREVMTRFDHRDLNRDTPYFEAAHILSHPGLSAAENARIYGKCANPAGHGHDYGLEITVAGEIDPASGQIFDRGRLDALVAELVLDRFGHSLLNDDPIFAGRVPTAENIALAIEAELGPAVASRPGARLLRVRLEETRKNSFETGELR
jgi:6-pyruvoyltetrahydropterin/6-carboxytetrahydropterin synthase